MADATAPRLQGLVLFEHYEVDGSLLLVTSDVTAAEPDEYNHA